MGQELLEVKNLSVSFRMYQGALKHTLVTGMHGVNLRLTTGEILAVVGASGSGKSLLAHAVLGILPYNAVTSGEMLYRGTALDAARQEELRGRELALIPQSVTYLDPLMRVGEEVCGLHGSPVDMAATFRRLHLEEKVQRLYPFQLSGGMARRVLFSTAVITDAALIIADEPTPGMDVKSAVAVFYEGRTVDRVPAAAFCGDGSDLQHPYTQALYHALPQNSFKVYSAQEVRQMTEAGGA